MSTIFTPVSKSSIATLAVTLWGSAMKTTSTPLAASLAGISSKTRSVTPARLKWTSLTFLPMLSAAVTRTTSTPGWKRSRRRISAPP